MSFSFIPPNLALQHNVHPLDGVYARLDRADDNIRNLDLKLREFRTANPQSFGTQINPDTGKFSHDAVFVKNPGYWVPVRIGEILFLLRSSLDHLVAQWLIPRTPEAERDDVLSNSGFPIYDDITRWPKFQWSKIPRATPELITAITDCQPCNRTDGKPPKDHPLAVLHAMNNTDKHRLLIITVIKSSTAAKIGPEFKGTMDFIGSPYVPGSSDVTGYVHAPLVTGFVDIASGGRMDVDFQSSTEVAFKQVGTRQGEPVIPTLEHLAKSVRDLITSFKNDPRLF